MESGAKKQIDWFRAVVHFLCGGLIGGCLGVAAVPEALLGDLAGILIVLVCAVLLGTLAGVCGQRLWNWLFG